MLGQATGNLNSQDSPWPGLGGSHHLPPYSILCVSPRGLHPNGFLSRDSQVRVPKLPKLNSYDFGAPQLCVKTFDRDKTCKNFVALVGSFPKVCGTPPACKEIGSIPDF